MRVPQEPQSDYMRAPNPTLEGLRREHDLLFCAARVCTESETAERMRTLLRSPIDWAYLQRAALQHGLLPLLYWHLKEDCADLVPEAVLQQLQQAFLDNAQKNLFLTGELLKILDGFRSQKIPVIPLKGPVLAASVYGNVALRQFCDLDILVHKRDVRRAKEALVSLGYRHALKLDKTQEASYVRSRYDYPFESHGGWSLVELHWGITPRYFSFALDFESLWEHANRTSLAGREVPTFCPEDYLLLLAVHGCKHVWKRLSWIVDIAELVRVNRELDWSRVIEQSAQLHSRRVLLLAVLLAHELLGAVLPEEIVALTRSDPKAKAIERHVREQIFVKTTDMPGILKDAFFQLRVKERLRDRIRFCFGMAVSMNLGDWEIVTFPRSLFFLYYPLRAVRLIKKYGLALLS